MTDSVEDMEVTEHCDVEEDQEATEEDSEFTEDVQNLADAEINDATIRKYQQVHEDEFEELRLPAAVAAEIRQCWQDFLAKFTSAELAGLAIYDAIFEDAPGMRVLFTSPRTIFALTFTNFLSNIFAMCNNPFALKSSVETLGFQHLDREVTPARLAIFAGAILNSMDAELGREFAPEARAGIVAMLNYIGGAIVYCRQELGARIKTIQRSWKIANHSHADTPSEPPDEAEQDEAIAVPSGDKDRQITEDTVASSGERPDPTAKGKSDEDDTRNTADIVVLSEVKDVKVPTTFNEMFLFNAAVMGFADSKWMHVVLERFDAMATNVANTTRLQEECDVLSLLISRYNRGQVVLPQFKAVMLASLRSMVPKDWDMDHEVAWNWFWENMEKMLKKMMGVPQSYTKVLNKLLSSLDEASISRTRQVVFQRFFELAPSAESFMKQSSTRMYYIADKIMEMTIDICENTRHVVDDISGLGLRHVGYGVPTEYFPPMVQAYCEAIDNLCHDRMGPEAFRWSLTLITKILTRVILEGSTVVMKAINTNQESAVRQAVAVAPRGKRAMEVLSVSVGTQTISPLYWAIDSGSLNCARAIIEDLLTIRADRDVYYYGCEALFTRHPEIVQKMCTSAPSLLIPLFDGLVWRSRLTKDGSRRVNLYIQHLVQDSKGAFSPTLQWLVQYNNPKIMSHLVVALTTDLIWSRFAALHFLWRRCYFLLTLCLFFVSQSVLKEHTAAEEVFEANVARCVLRLWLYIASLCGLYGFVKDVAIECRRGQVIRTSILPIPIPKSFASAKKLGQAALVWVLMFMLVFEPILRCASTWMDKNSQYLLFTTHCGVEEEIRIYSVFSAVGMALFWLLLTDCTVFSMRLSAFLLVCGWVAMEVCLFLLALMFLIVVFSTALSSFQHDLVEFDGATTWIAALVQMAFGMFPASGFAATEEDFPIFLCLTLFMALATIFLMNLLIAQLVESYRTMFADMTGFARLNRAGVVVSVLAEARTAQFAKFLRALSFEERLEFNEGDSGPAGGIQIHEPANEFTVTEDSILRYGGPTAPSVPWPEDDRKVEESTEEKLQHVENRLASMEKLLTKMAKTKGINVKNGSRMPSVASSRCSDHSQ
ncbi:unnamed protein product [Symbiodinium natans]|uniref:Globin family profile domain-containing protein n=1 Tax=Symbiodinium natans TaxID=878477 RepID=A0A812HFK7_9DINO|nr:unnamed protein product [Symbiodinium natans]